MTLMSVQQMIMKWGVRIRLIVLVASRQYVTIEDYKIQKTYFY